jgi:hypothetical protein
MVKRHRIVSLVVGLQSLSPAFRYLRGSQRRTPTRSTTFFSNQCLQPINDTGQGAAIVQEPCNGGAAQQWTEVSVGSNVFHYVNVLSGLCLDARGGAVNGTPSSNGRATASATRNGNLEKMSRTKFHH